MPKNPENQLRIAGQKYFRPMEITGSSNGDDKNPKFSLQFFFRTHLMEKLDQAVKKEELETNSKVII